MNNRLPKIINGFQCYSPEKIQEDIPSFNRGAFEKLVKVEDNFFWFKKRSNIITYILKKYFGSFSNFLEIGCGTGFVTRSIKKEFPDSKIRGSEIFMEGLLQAENRLNKNELIQMDALNIPFKDEFDLIGMFDVLEHIEDDERVLSQIYSALKVDGGLIITVPHHKFLWSRTDEIACHQRRYSTIELIEKVNQAGFSIKYYSCFISILMPVFFLSRKLSKSKDNDASEEFKLPRLINFLFGLTVDIEKILIKLGVRIPFGSSIILTAIKK